MYPIEILKENFWKNERIVLHLKKGRTEHFANTFCFLLSRTKDMTYVVEKGYKYHVLLCNIIEQEKFVTHFFLIRIILFLPSLAILKNFGF